MEVPVCGMIPLTQVGDWDTVLSSEAGTRVWPGNVCRWNGGSRERWLGEGRPCRHADGQDWFKIRELCQVSAKVPGESSFWQALSEPFSYAASLASRWGVGC